MKNKKILIISIILLLIVLAIALFATYSRFKRNETNGGIHLENLYGTYYFEKTLNNTYKDGNVIETNIRCILTLNSDGTATYQASDGYVFESTKGTYKYENKTIKYTKEYLNYEGQEDSTYDDLNSKNEIFIVLDNEKLESTFRDEKIVLIKSNNAGTN